MSRDRDGFTIIEFMTVCLVMGTLAAIATLSTYSSIKRAKNAAVMSAGRTLAQDHVGPTVARIPKKRAWGGRNNEKFVNGSLNRALSAGRFGNVYRYENPVSGSAVVEVRGNPRRTPPAFFVTKNRRYRYDRWGEGQRQDRLRGSVVIFLHKKDPYEVYAVDADGYRGALLWSN